MKTINKVVALPVPALLVANGAAQAASTGISPYVEGAVPRSASATASELTPRKRALGL